ncbi:MAG: WxcM-like domain-containing protein, partial [Clostridiaceae bacterium]|nr:WxcM-like domain-containing protein [Clostridiaceae bacterium]
MNYELISIKTVQTEKEGQLSFFEARRDIPFDIKRIYYISNVPSNKRRGAHAHKKLLQLLFCPYGSVTVQLDDGKEKKEIVLDKPSEGLLLYPGLWRDIIWNMDYSVLCV